MVPLFVPEEQWGAQSWGVNHPLYVQGHILHGMVEAGYGYWGFLPANNPSGGYREYGVVARAWRQLAILPPMTTRWSMSATLLPGEESLSQYCPLMRIRMASERRMPCSWRSTLPRRRAWPIWTGCARISTSTAVGFLGLS